MDVLDVLGIDYAKLIAQTINFGIVMFVLWKWAYRPILDLLEERRRKIEQSMRDADRIRQEMAAAEAARQEMLSKANADATRMIEEARAAAARVQDMETQRAIAAAEQIIQKAQEAAQREHERRMEELKREIVRLVVDTTARVSGKVLTPEDQRRLAEATLQQLAA